MSRIRSVHPGFFTDESIVSVSMAARICIIGLGIEADDKGVFEWKPIMLKMRLFPADSVDVEEILAELEAVQLVKKFSAKGRNYGAIRNFRKFQKPKTPNDIHPAPPDILIFVGLAEPISEKANGKAASFPPKGEIAPQMEDGGEDVEELEPDGSCASGDALKPEHVSAKWNEIAGSIGLPKIRDLTPERRQLVRARIGQYSLDDFVTVFGKIADSPFLRGEKRWRGATFDWAMKKSNFQKIIEGNYDDQPA